MWREGPETAQPEKTGEDGRLGAWAGGWEEVSLSHLCWMTWDFEEERNESCSDFQQDHADSSHVFCAKRHVSLFLFLEPRILWDSLSFLWNKFLKNQDLPMCPAESWTAQPAGLPPLQRPSFRGRPGPVPAISRSPLISPCPPCTLSTSASSVQGRPHRDPSAFWAPFSPGTPCPATLVIFSPLTRFLIIACLCGLHFPQCECFSQGLSALGGLPSVPALVWCLLVWSLQLTWSRGSACVCARGSCLWQRKLKVSGSPGTWLPWRPLGRHVIGLNSSSIKEMESGNFFNGGFYGRQREI